LEGQIDRASMTTSMHSLDYVILTRIIDIQCTKRHREQRWSSLGIHVSATRTSCYVLLGYVCRFCIQTRTSHAIYDVIHNHHLTFFGNINSSQATKNNGKYLKLALKEKSPPPARFERYRNEEAADSCTQIEPHGCGSG
jgi:hypothetical protein